MTIKNFAVYDNSTGSGIGNVINGRKNGADGTIAVSWDSAPALIQDTSHSDRLKEYYLSNHSLSLVCNSCSRLRSRKAQLKQPFLQRQSTDLSPKLYFLKTLRSSLFMPSGMLLNDSDGVFFSGIFGAYSSRCF